MPSMALKQLRRQIHWFCSNGIHHVDLAIRVPKQPGIDYRSPDWSWRMHRNIVTDEIQKSWQAWIRHMNATGSDIYIRPHGEGSFAFLFLDDLPLEKARRVATKYASCIVETSPGNTQVWLLTTACLSKGERAQAQQHLRDLGCTDPGSVSGDHFGRLCGLKSQKRQCWVNLSTISSARRYDVVLTKSPPSFPLPEGGRRCASSLSSSQSERDFGWVCGRLRAGHQVEQILLDLERKATERGKKNPKQYAQRTVINALRLI
jgi:RepB DNA-primase from phage plasmid